MSHHVPVVLAAAPWPAYVVALVPLALGVFLLLPGRAERESDRHHRKPFPFLTLLKPQVPFLRGTMPPAVVRVQAVMLVVMGVVGLVLLTTTW